jgi:DNA-binding NtrC family response regulator
MLNGLQTVSLHQSAPGSSGDLQPAQNAATPFVCVSSALRRLLIQAEVAVPRLQFAVIDGEAGTGKHVFAQHLHRQSTALRNLPFRHRDARAWLASEVETSSLVGTLYLDRVDLLAPTGQGLLLNLIKLLQSDAAPQNRFLLLASAHTPVRLLATQGRFLPDLAFRLSAVRFSIPPLREHREDIAPITQALIDRICRRYQQPTAVLAPGTLPRLLQHAWPGNVRELASVLESAILDSSTGVLRPGDLQLDAAPQTYRPETLAVSSSAALPPLPPSHLALEAVIRNHIQIVLDLNRGNKLRAARQLGISRSTLYRILAGESTLPA